MQRQLFTIAKATESYCRHTWDGDSCVSNLMGSTRSKEEKVRVEQEKQITPKARLKPQSTSTTSTQHTIGLLGSKLRRAVLIRLPSVFRFGCAPPLQDSSSQTCKGRASAETTLCLVACQTSANDNSRALSANPYFSRSPFLQDRSCKQNPLVAPREV